MGRYEVCPAWQFFSIREAKRHAFILHPKYKKSSLSAKTEFTYKFKGCNMVFSSHHSLRNHVAEKDHYVRSRPNNNKKVDKAQQAKKRRTLSIFLTNLLKLNQSRKLKVQSTRKTNGNADGAQKNGMLRTETDGSFVITVMISITCNARGCSTRKANVMISISKVESFIVMNVNLDSKHFHC